MSIPADEIQNIRDKAEACNYDGSARVEWEDARNVSCQELHDLIHEHFHPIQLLSTDPCNLMLTAFVWGYECAVRKERENYGSELPPL